MQRGLLRAIEDAYSEARPELWTCIGDLDLGLGEHPESRRRAAHQLEAAGLIELCTELDDVPGNEDAFGFRAVARKRLFARLPLDPASAQYAREGRERYLANARLARDSQASDEARDAALAAIRMYREPEDMGEFFGVERVARHTKVPLRQSSAATRLRHR